MRPRRVAALAAALAGLGLCLLLLVVLSGASVLSGAGEGDISPVGLPAGAGPFLAMYADAGDVYRVSPFVLMAIHENETDFSRSNLPGVGTGINFAGCCAGPMQFSIAGGASQAQGGLGATWGAYRLAYRAARLPRPARYPLRVERPHPNVYDSYDAIYAAALYLRRLGAGPELDQTSYEALLSYTGSPPASVPYARADFERARELQAIARRHRPGSTVPPVPVGATLSWPLPSSYTVISSPFGMRWGRLHAGVDIPAPAGTVIHAAAGGRVTVRGWVSGYGLYTCLQHRGPWSTCYAHQSRLGPTPPGGLITRGDLVGYVGCTGHCFGYHLHFELRLGGRPIDPMPYLRGGR
jgi:hypothetical protein